MAPLLLAELDVRPAPQAIGLAARLWQAGISREIGAIDDEFRRLLLPLDDVDLFALQLVDDSLHALATGQHRTDLIGADALHVAGWWRERSGAASTLGFAAVNALSRHLFERAGYVPPDALDSIAGLDPQRGEHIGMVGFFPPLVRQITARGARLTVLELRADLAGAHEGYTVTLDPRALRDCDKVLSTSTVLLNHSLQSVLAHCRQARQVALVGPGAGCLPDVLFACGVSTLGGSWITDAGGFKEALGRGLAWGAHARKFVIQASDWPPTGTLAG